MEKSFKDNLLKIFPNFAMTGIKEIDEVKVASNLDFIEKKGA